MHPLEKLDVTSSVAKRAQYEAFEFSLATDGVVVRNCSHAEPGKHEYLVNIEDDLPSACTCPADECYDGACKHRVAVAIRRPLLDAATAEAQVVAADGGLPESTMSAPPSPRESPDGTPDDTENADVPDCEACREEFPCFECVLTGRRDLPE